VWSCWREAAGVVKGGGEARRVRPSAAREAVAGMAGAVVFRLGPWMTMACEYDMRLHGEV